MPKKILIIRLSSIGDIVLTTPILRCLRLQTQAEIHYLTKPAFANILRANPHVQRVITWNDSFNETISELKAQDYDFIVDLHHNLRSARIKMALRKPSAAFRKLNFQKWLKVNFKINRLPDLHIVDRYFETVSSLGVQNDGKGLDFYIPEDRTVNVSESLQLNPGSYCAIVIGAAHATKCMTAAQMAEICSIVSIPVVLLGGKKEQAKAAEIMSLTTGTVIDACGRFDIFQSASVLQQASRVISHDTGLMHIAAALQKQQTVVWGNTIPQFGMYPYYGDTSPNLATHFEIIGLSCRPCSKIGYEKCPKGHFKCMLDHDLEKIVNSN